MRGLGGGRSLFEFVEGDLICAASSLACFSFFFIGVMLVEICDFLYFLPFFGLPCISRHPIDSCMCTPFFSSSFAPVVLRACRGNIPLR